MMTSHTRTVPLADHAWPDDAVERAVIRVTSDASVVELRRRATEEVVRVLGGLPPIHQCNTPVGTNTVRAER